MSARMFLCMMTFAFVCLAQQAVAPPTTAVVFDGSRVGKLLTQPMPNAKGLYGGTLVAGEHYKVLPLRRETPGQVEVHAVDTDVIYVLAGDANFVTGGSVIGSKETAPEETRGTSIEGGVAHALHAGDVVIVPNGQPHWFQRVSPAFRYLTVKAR
jgi:mannose-6-phosphate isomerase-like protein (cupin superfamily)